MSPIAGSAQRQSVRAFWRDYEGGSRARSGRSGALRPAGANAAATPRMAPLDAVADVGSQIEEQDVVLLDRAHNSTGLGLD
jgi:hypothetical protein